MSGAGAWTDFWNRADTGVYVNRRNLEAHFAELRDGLAPHMPSAGAVLDYGCGDALAADDLAAACGGLTLYDAAPAVRARLRARYAGHPRIRVVDEEELTAATGGFEVITVVSVAQYVPRDELPALLLRWREMLTPGGRLILADVVPPDVSPLRDAASQLAFARRHGFFLAALAGLAKLALSDYRKIRKTAGFSVYTAQAVLALLRDAGFDARRLTPNIGPTPHRLSFIATAAATPVEAGGQPEDPLGEKVQ